MIKKLTIIFLMLLLAATTFLVTFTSLNWLWEIFAIFYKGSPDQNYFTFGFKVNLAIATGYSTCTLLAALICIKDIPSSINSKIFWGPFLSAIFVAIYFFLFDFIPPAMSTFLIFLLLTLPFFAVFINVAFIRLFAARSKRHF